ncbi:lipase family protein [Oscillatoria amoena NRMC-F 0135]|nr:lipase family protein [Oscillatoria amoena NRMC-F 0135]MDL5053496.1 lipase family protein [Oscillatoria laete-virens NRMC-F 0139]
MSSLKDLKFAPDARSYNPQNALICATLSKLAYQTEQKIKNELTSSQYLNFRFFTDPHKDTQCFVATKDKALIVVFRGTEMGEMKDWNTNRKFGLSGGPLGKIHRGFLLALSSIWGDISQYIDDTLKKHPGLLVWMTGHSLGGALATIATAYMLEENKPVTGVYTFGQPRVGDADFSNVYNQKFKDRHHCFVNNADIVPRVPPRALGYTDVGNIIFIDNGKNVHFEIEAWNISLNRLRSRIDKYISGKSPITDVEHHSIDEYILAVEKNLKLG